MRMKALAVLGVLLLLGVFAMPAFAQEQSGAVEGVIKDSSGGVLPGVTVEARTSAGVQTAITDAKGIFRFPALPPGAYEVTASRIVAMSFCEPRSWTRVLSS